MNLKNKNCNHMIIFLQTAFILILFISMVLFPREIFNASLRGLNAWLNVVFPALFPFFVISEFFMNFGLVNSLGVLLEPIMRPLFKVPGSGAFVMAVGYTSGAPISSIITSKLRKEEKLSRVEAERLISFTNNASPLFILGAISVGMLQQPASGITIALSHYTANLFIGIFILRHWGKNEKNTTSSKFKNKKLLQKAYNELLKAYSQNTKSFGTMLKEAVKNSINTLVFLGGFIIVFSTLIEIFEIYGIINIIASLLNFIFFFTNTNFDVLQAIISGIFEMTVGSKLVSEIGITLQQKIAAISFIIGWAGLSIHAQVLAVINETDIRITPFIFARILQAILAALLSLTLFKPVSTVFQNVTYFNMKNFTLNIISGSLQMFICIILILLSISIIYQFLKYLTGKLKWIKM